MDRYRNSKTSNSSERALRNWRKLSSLVMIPKDLREKLLSYQKLINTHDTADHSSSCSSDIESPLLGISSNDYLEATAAVKLTFKVIRICLQIVAVCFDQLASIFKPHAAHYALKGAVLAAAAVFLYIVDLLCDLIRLPQLRRLRWRSRSSKNPMILRLLCGFFLWVLCTRHYLGIRWINEGFDIRETFAVLMIILCLIYAFITDPCEERFTRDHDIGRSKRKVISAEWGFLVTSIGLEILSAGFEQVSSPSKPRFALFGLLFAIVAVLISLWELIRKGRKERVLELRRWGMLWWFYYPSPRNELFGTLPDIYGLLGGISQCIFSAVQYVCHIRHVDNPINLSLLPCIFLICLAVSKSNSKRMTNTRTD